jgi:FdrA protein
MVRTIVVMKNRYFDSVFLMLAARRVKAQPGIADASALLATAANREVLAAMGYDKAELAGAGPGDLVLALEGEVAAVAAIAADPETWLSRGSGPGPGAAPEPRSFAEAVAARPACSVAVISVPGAFAAREARAALREGLNVFLFSSNVSVAEERSLKLEARERGLIVMGPDCGTAFLGGAGIGFANAVRRGPIGMVGSTGTGMQEFSSLAHQAGSGISNGIGTGSRDLADAVGGISTMAGIEALENDPGTRVIAVLAKPPEPAATARLVERLGRCRKPVVLCLLGAEVQGTGGIRTAATIDEAVALALVAAGSLPPVQLRPDDRAMGEQAVLLASQLGPEQRHIRGLFAGGTLCYQSQAVFRQAGLVLRANSPLRGMLELPDPWVSRESCFIDLGAERFVEGRPHPMIDATLRGQRLEQEGRDPSVAVILLDFILGAMASRDPVGDLLGAIGGVQDTARRRGGRILLVASVTGTDDDAQGLQAQTRALVEAGVLVLPSNGQAAAFCREIMLRIARRKEVH